LGDINQLGSGFGFEFSQIHGGIFQISRFSEIGRLQMQIAPQERAGTSACEEYAESGVDGRR
jgi:hypothetical protein